MASKKGTRATRTAAAPVASGEAPGGAVPRPAGTEAAAAPPSPPDLRPAALEAARHQYPALGAWLLRHGWREGDDPGRLPGTVMADYLGDLETAGMQGAAPAVTLALRRGFLAAPPADFLAALWRGLLRRYVARVLLVVPAGNPAWFADWVRVHTPDLGAAMGLTFAVAAAGGQGDDLARFLAANAEQHDQTVVAGPLELAEELLSSLRALRIHLAPLKLRFLLLNPPWDPVRRARLGEPLHLARHEIMAAPGVVGFPSLGVLGVDSPLLGLLQAYEHDRPGLAGAALGVPAPQHLFIFDPMWLGIEESAEGLLLSRCRPSPLFRLRTGLRGRVLPREALIEGLQRLGYDPLAELRPLDLAWPTRALLAVIEGGEAA